MDAQLKFVQGATVGAPGQAVFGNINQPVTASNGGDNTGARRWKFEWLFTPVSSAIPRGVAQFGGQQTFTFTPDFSGGFLLKITLIDEKGNEKSDIRCFGVRDLVTGNFLPPANALGDSLNFGGQPDGWQPYINEWLEQIQASGVGVQFPIATTEGAIAIGDALCPSQTQPGKYRLATTANVTAAGGQISGMVVTSGSGGTTVTGISAGVFPAGLLSAGSASALIVNAGGQIVRALVGRTVGWANSDGAGFFFLPRLAHAGLRNRLNALDFGLVAGDSSAPVRTANRIAMQAFIDALSSGGGTDGKITGVVPGGHYYFDAGVADVTLGYNIVLWMRRRAHFEGDQQLGTIFEFPVGCVAIAFQYNSVGDTPGDSQYGEIRHLRIQSVSPSPSFNQRVDSGGAFQNRRDHGILIMCAGVRVDNVQVGNMGGTGCLVDAPNIGGFDVLNANDVSVTNCLFEQNGGKGWWIRDGDNNSASIFQNCHCPFNADGDWAEQSFLGNTVVGGASHSDTGGGKIIVGDPAGATAFSTVIGAYNEGNDKPFVHTPAIMIGGNAAFQALRNPYNDGMIICGGGDGGCRNLNSKLFKHTTAPYLAGQTVAVGNRRRPSTTVLANGREYICISITSGVCGAEPSEYVRTLGGGDPDPGGPGTNPALVGATFTSGGATWQEAGPIRATEEATAYVDLASGQTGFFFALVKKEDGNDVQGWTPGDNNGSLGVGWWYYTRAASTNDVCMAISNARNAEAHAHTGALVPWLGILKFGVPGSGQVAFIDIGNAAPTSGSRYQGDFRFNKFPGAEGTIAAWQNCSAGTPGGPWAPVWNDGVKLAHTAQTALDWADTASTDSGTTAAKSAVRSRRRGATTTTATANQVLDDGGTWGDQNLSLVEGDVMRIDDLLVGKRNGQSEATAIHCTGWYYVEGGTLFSFGSPTTVTDAEVGANIVNTSANQNINGLKVELRVSPANAITIDWTWVRQYTRRAE